VRKLPHDLVEAFKSTLEEVVNSELLLHVVDAASDKAMEQIEAVNGVLTELGAKDKSMILLLNKIDKASEEALSILREKYSDMEIIEISAKDNLNLDKLLELVSKSLPNALREVEYLIPYTDTATVALLHRSAKVLEEEYKEDGTRILVLVDEEVYNKCKQYELILK
jgi:GTP-binding protein HflX